VFLTSRLWVLGLALLIVCFSTPAFAETIPIFDAHNQMDDGLTVNEMISLMDAAGVERIFFAGRVPRHDTFVLEAAKLYPKRIFPLLRTKGDKDFEASDANLKRQFNDAARDPRYFGMAELLVYHAFKPAYNERERKIFLTDAKVGYAIEFAEKRKWPLILHIEMAAAGEMRQTYMNQLEQFLSDHPQLPVLMMHMAQLDSMDVERLIQTHPNIHFMTGHLKFLSGNPDKEDSSEQVLPWTPMFMEGRLLEPWKDLFLRYPERFIYASDAMLVNQWRKRYVKRIHIWQRVFQELPSDVAHKIAHQNAERLWHLEEYSEQR